MFELTVKFPCLLPVWHARDLIRKLLHPVSALSSYHACHSFIVGELVKHRLHFVGPFDGFHALISDLLHLPLHLFGPLHRLALQLSR